MLDIQSNYLQKKKSHKSISSLLKRNQNLLAGEQTQLLGTHRERILNVCKSSWLTCIEVKWDVDIYYRPIAAKLTPQILRPEHRKYKCNSNDHHGQLYLHHHLVIAGRAASERTKGTLQPKTQFSDFLPSDLTNHLFTECMFSLIKFGCYLFYSILFCFAPFLLCFGCKLALQAGVVCKM